MLESQFVEHYPAGNVAPANGIGTGFPQYKGSSPEPDPRLELT